MSGIALIFPGQGSQAVGMGESLWQTSNEAKEVFAQADEALGYNLTRFCFAGSEEDLRRTENAQPAILTVSVAAYRAFTALQSITPMFLAGHSFGEYSALVAAGVLAFPDAIRLVRRRGELMAEALPAGEGTMAAILGLDEDKLAAVLAEAGMAGIVEMATLNCPGQVVVAGQTGAVTEAGRLAIAAGAKQGPAFAGQRAFPFQPDAISRGPVCRRFGLVVYAARRHSGGCQCYRATGDRSFRDKAAVIRTNLLTGPLGRVRPLYARGRGRDFRGVRAGEGLVRTGTPDVARGANH